MSRADQEMSGRMRKAAKSSESSKGERKNKGSVETRSVCLQEIEGQTTSNDYQPTRTDF